MGELRERSRCYCDAIGLLSASLQEFAKTLIMEHDQEVKNAVRQFGEERVKQMWADAAMIKAKIDEISATTPPEQSDDDDVPELVAVPGKQSDLMDDLTIHDLIPPTSEEERIGRQKWLASGKKEAIKQMLDEDKQQHLNRAAAVAAVPVVDEAIFQAPGGPSLDDVDIDLQS
jgi:hypothetical protein